MKRLTCWGGAFSSVGLLAVVVVGCSTTDASSGALSGASAPGATGEDASTNAQARSDGGTRDAAPAGDARSPGDASDASSAGGGDAEAGAPAGSYSAAAYKNIVNGQPPPADFVPYCRNSAPNPSAPCPNNDPLPEHPQELLPNSSGIVSTVMSPGPGGAGVPRFEGNYDPAYDGNPGMYLASESDPLVTVTCVDSGGSCGWANTPGPVTIHVPPKAYSPPSSDKNWMVIQPDGTEYDFWLADYSGGSTATAAAIQKTSIFGSGWCDPSTYPNCPVAANGQNFGVMATSIRIDELQRGVIPHAINWGVACTNGAVFPGTSASDCTTNASNAPPAGARWQLTMSHAEIDALDAAPWEKAILHAMHRYGVYTSITNGETHDPAGEGLRYAGFGSSSYFANYGQPFPASQFDLSSPGNNGSVGTPPTTWRPGGIDWASHLQIVSPCYARETCSDSANADWSPP